MIAHVATLVALLAMAHGGLLDGGLELGGAISSIASSGIALGGKETVVDLISPPKYKYNYAVQDPKTGDLKQQEESRVDDLTKSEYSVAEKDRKIAVARVITKSIPLVTKGSIY